MGVKGACDEAEYSYYSDNIMDNLDDLDQLDAKT